LTRTLGIAGTLALAAVLLLTACDQDGANGPLEGGNGVANGTTVQATMTDFEIDLQQQSAPAGTVTFVVDNQGPSEHEFAVIRSDAAADELPLEGGVAVVDDADVVDEIRPYPAGQMQELTVDVEAGRYLIICNVPGHYQLGMHAEFSVQ
jgi:uncharacterized cupredoxin-like copper-binding protein